MLWRTPVGPNRMSMERKDVVVPNALRAVLFDLGDTLVRLDAADGCLVMRAADKLGAKVPSGAAAAMWARVVAAASTAEELGKGRDLSPQRHRGVWTDLYRRAGAEELAPGLAETVYELTVDPQSWVAFPDAVPALRTLQESGVPVGVITDTGFDVGPILKATGLAPFIGGVVMSYRHGACKPDASIFLAACQLLGSDPSETLMVGDNVHCDSGGAAAGLPTLLLPPPGRGPRGLDLVLRLLK
jgi:FMN phosphatase YigB (HAD superfamily)